MDGGSVCWPWFPGGGKHWQPHILQKAWKSFVDETGSNQQDVRGEWNTRDWGSYLISLGAASRASESLADRVQAKTALLMVARALPLPPCLPVKRECLPTWVFCRPTCPLDVG